MRILLGVFLTVFAVLISGCSDTSSKTESFKFMDLGNVYQVFFYYNGILYMESPSFDHVYTKLPEDYTYVGETVNVGTIFDLGEMESNVSGSVYKNESTVDTAIIAFSGDLYEDGLPRYLLCIPCEQ